MEAIRVDGSIDLAAAPTHLPTRDDTKRLAAAESKTLAYWVARLAAESQRSLLVVFQAMDAGGKDGCIRRVFRHCSHNAVRTTRFSVPSESERARDFLWRHHAEVPAAGHVGVWNRSHYGGVLVERVLNIVDDGQLERRYAHIRNFEQMLVDEGTQVVKFFLHIGKDEQRTRLQRRLDDPTKRWKFDQSDLDQRAAWDQYQDLYGRALGATSTADAPWFIVPADDKRQRDLLVARTLVATLAKMAPDYPRVTGLPDTLD